MRETASGAECVVEYPLFYINIGDTCNKEMGFKYFGWFRNAKRHRQDTKNLVATKNYIATSYLVAIISIIISNILPHVVDEKASLDQDIFYQIKPIYNPINMYSVQSNIRISTKIIKVLKDIYGMKKTKEKLKINVQPV